MQLAVPLRARVASVVQPAARGAGKTHPSGDEANLGPDNLSISIGGVLARKYVSLLTRQKRRLKWHDPPLPCERSPASARTEQNGSRRAVHRSSCLLCGPTISRAEKYSSGKCTFGIVDCLSITSSAVFSINTLEGRASARGSGKKKKGPSARCRGRRACEPRDERRPEVRPRDRVPPEGAGAGSPDRSGRGGRACEAHRRDLEHTFFQTDH